MKQDIDFNRKQKVHFIGIGGISMSAIAQVLLSRGFDVTGSDAKASDMTEQLKNLGAEIFIGQSADNISSDVDMVVYTAAISVSSGAASGSASLSSDLPQAAALISKASMSSRANALFMTDSTLKVKSQAL